jgi:hypothetical protein
LRQGFDRNGIARLLDVADAGNLHLHFGAILAVLISALVQTPGSSSKSAAEPLQLLPNEMVRRAMEHDVHNWAQEKNYTFTRRVDEHELNADGTVKSRKSESEEILFLYGQPHANLSGGTISRCGKGALDETTHWHNNHRSDVFSRRCWLCGHAVFVDFLQRQPDQFG